MSSVIEDLKLLFPTKVFESDTLLEKQFEAKGTWTHLSSGGEHDIFTTRDGEFVIKQALPLSEEEYDSDDGGVDEYGGRKWREPSGGLRDSRWN